MTKNSICKCLERSQSSIDIEKPSAEDGGDGHFDLDLLFAELILHNLVHRHDIDRLFDRLRAEGHLPDVSFLN